MLKRAQKSDNIAFNIELVKAVEKHPCIYDYNMKEYCNREFVDSAWQKIAKKFHCPAKECREAWKNLRIVFSRNIKKQTTGAGSTKKPYYLLESMRFLIPFMKNSSSTTQLKPINEAIYYETTSDEQTSNRDEEEDEIIASNNDQSKSNITDNLENVMPKEEYDSEKEIMFEQEFLREQITSRNKKQPDILNNEIHKHHQTPDEIQMESLSPNKNQKTSQAALNNSSYIDLINFAESNSVTRMSRGNYKHQFLTSLFPDVDDMDDTQFRLFRLEVCKIVSNIFSSQTPTQQPTNRTSYWQN
ncbi:uncharacterized protein LOC129940023 [Eupeodes corollae]|uniref:uncharacterized protein LOC129940023 n=1 Tax=Eupeodes corollae TaxID=290404 RepID=UPI002491C802|nr:uncharacterized protein LOC129940023 [Eupeodes corollae]XP_055904222.1 uncharacterized protein LOC129940023 [Eupeodes corollae]